MKVCVLASGSKGNSTFISVNNHNILIDVGISLKELKEKLLSIGVNIEDIDTILITHAHVDHTASLSKVYKKCHANIYMTDKTYEETKNDFIKDIEYITLTNDLVIDDIVITNFKTSHDVDSRGYIVTYDNKSVVYITDTGYINNKYYDMLTNKNIYVFESNHDPEMLMNGEKPLDKKERVYGDRGHLCNSQAGYYLSMFVGDNTKHIYLAHISRKDNTNKLAYDTVCECLRRKNKPIDDIEIADQFIISSLQEI